MSTTTTERSLAYLSEVSVERVKGIGPTRGKQLAKADVASVTDLLLTYPKRHIDRSTTAPLAQLPLETMVTAVGVVTTAKMRRIRKNLSITDVVITDGEAFLTAVFFNQTFRVRQLTEGTEVAFAGEVERKRGKLQMKPKEVDVLSQDREALGTGRVVPAYSSINKVSAILIRSAMFNALARSRPIADPISEEVLESLGLISRDQALADMHFPEEPIDLVPARERLVFDELFRLELALALKKQRQLEESSGLNHDVSAGLVEAFIDGLPYDLTGAQIRSLEEIQADMASPHPMHRLLQGEVGSGKTAVAVASILTAVQGGYQGAVMAPTEVLADQHYIGMRPLCEQVGVRMGLLTGSSAERDETLAALIEGTLDVVVGTHALIQDGVTFANLGLAVIDEQHRFGVHQRVQLRQKGAGADPDLLIMTATPIPRTLAMTAYGDLDVSVLDEMPPGRSPVETTVVSRNDEDSIWAIMREEVAAGRQAFVVCPLVEESDALNVASAVSEHARLQALLSGLRVGLLHGQMKSQEKEAVMASMRDGGLDVLVATTVIEVGIDVPNATLMVIEDAQRFGLSQLHQLRGRVGRGQWPGRCIAISDAQWNLDEKGKLANPDGQARLDAFESTTDGFVLAEADLKIRKQGTVLGVRQSGMPDLKLADIVDDRELLESARELAFGLVAEDPNLESHSDLADELRVLLGDETDLLLHS